MFLWIFICIFRVLLTKRNMDNQIDNNIKDTIIKLFNDIDQCNQIDSELLQNFIRYKDKKIMRDLK